MKKIDSVISLLHSLSKSEKKHITLHVLSGNENKDYLFIYDLIINQKIYDTQSIKKEFTKSKPTGSFEIAVHYLYDKILNSLLTLRKKKDIIYDLFQIISKVRMLYERSLFRECFELLSEAIETARKYQYYEILIIALKLELEYLFRLNFPDISEQELYHRHYELGDAIKNIRNITEQSSLHDTLKYRLIYKGSIRTDKQKREMNDLMVSEFYIAASTESKNNFEIKKNHQLFQSSYLMGVGDFNSALQTLKELNRVFENNPQHWANPPIYYMSVLEGILSSLRFYGNYEEMGYYVEKLKVLADSSSVEFKVNTLCLAFQYELFPWLDKGDYEKCKEIIEEYDENLFSKESWLNPIRLSELILYTSIVHIGMKEFSKARKRLNSLLFDRFMDYLPIKKIIRLMRLIVYYELGDFDLIRFETRSIKRGMTNKKEPYYRTEHMLLWFLNNENLPVFNKDKDDLWKKISTQLNEWHNDRYERQILYLFDFMAWIEAKIFKKPLSVTMEKNFEEKMKNNVLP